MRRNRGISSSYLSLVSIHAPGRGATPRLGKQSRSRRSFNSRTREGCDEGLLTTTPQQITFQFTHPGGVRQVSLISSVLSTRFNSRTREGCDTGSGDPLPRPLSFNSRTREGCDPRVLSSEVSNAEFQFTHPGGVRLTAEDLRVHPRVSIHAPGRGATVARPTKLVISMVSIHAPGRGATTPTLDIDLISKFQFTHPGGVRQGGGRCHKSE